MFFKGKSQEVVLPSVGDPGFISLENKPPSEKKMKTGGGFSSWSVMGKYHPFRFLEIVS